MVLPSTKHAESLVDAAPAMNDAAKDVEIVPTPPSQDEAAKQKPGSAVVVVQDIPPPLDPERRRNFGSYIVGLLDAEWAAMETVCLYDIAHYVGMRRLANEETTDHFRLMLGLRKVHRHINHTLEDSEWQKRLIRACHQLEPSSLPHVEATTLQPLYSLLEEDPSYLHPVVAINEFLTELNILGRYPERVKSEAELEAQFTLLADSAVCRYNASLYLQTAESAKSVNCASTSAESSNVPAAVASGVNSENASVSRPARPIKCDVCHVALPSIRAARDHMRQVHKMTNEQMESLKDMCEQCGKGFTRKGGLTDHINAVHYKASTHVCDICAKVFTCKWNLTKHIRYVHIKASAHGCDICAKVFTRKSDLTKHINEVHIKDSTQVCDICAKVFTNKGGLIQHVKTVHHKIRDLVCDVCHVSFALRGHLNEHRLIHTGEKPFQCAFCLGRFRVSGDVLVHMARHVRSGEVKYEEAYAVHIKSKRQIFLRNSTMKVVKAICGVPSNETHKRMDASPATIVRNKAQMPAANSLPLISEETEDCDAEEEGADSLKNDL